MQRVVVCALAALAAGVAVAQTPARPRPADAKATPAARPVYESAFRDYRPYADPAVGRWREVNEEMSRLNGHVGHVPGSVPPAPRGAQSPPQAPAHGGHK